MLDDTEEKSIGVLDHGAISQWLGGSGSELWLYPYSCFEIGATNRISQPHATCSKSWGSHTYGFKEKDINSNWGFMVIN